MIQVNNRNDSETEPFTHDQQAVLEVAADELSHLMYSRADFSATAGEMEYVDDGRSSRPYSERNNSTLINSCTILTPFQIELVTASLGSWVDVIRSSEFVSIELTVSIYLALSMLCEARTISLGPPGSFASTPNINVSHRLSFDIRVKDLPRAARILFKLRGRRKNGTAESIGWAANTIFNFTGNMENTVDVRLFRGDIDAPVKTTLSNLADSTAPSMSLVLAADLVMQDAALNVHVIHRIKASTDPVIGEDENLSETEKAELERLKKLSFNPLALSLITNADREYLWGLRKQLINQSDLLPAFILSMQWHISDRVQELYALRFVAKTNPTPGLGST